MMFTNPHFIGGAAVGGLTILGFGLMVWKWSKIGATREHNRQAADELIKELTGIIGELDAYFRKVADFCLAYSDKKAIVTQLPDLRLQLDKVKFSAAYAVNTKKIEEHIPSSRWHPWLYKRTSVQLIAFKNLVNLLKASKLAGFMRSTRLLEEYINRTSASSPKKIIVDTFAEDYFDEMAYNIVKSLLAEKEIFDSADLQKTLTILQKDLNKIRDLNGKVTLLNMLAD